MFLTAGRLVTDMDQAQVLLISRTFTADLHTQAREQWYSVLTSQQLKALLMQHHLRLLSTISQIWLFRSPSTQVLRTMEFGA